METANKLGLGAGLLGLAGVGVMVVSWIDPSWVPDAYRSVIAVFGVTLAVVGLLGGIGFLIWGMPSVETRLRRRRAVKVEREKEAEKLAEADRREKESQQLADAWREPTTAWVGFYHSLNQTMAACNELYDARQRRKMIPTRLFRRLAELVNVSLSQVEAIHPVDRERLQPLLERLRKAAAERDVDAVRMLRHYLHDYSFRREAHHYRELRQRVGLPSPKDYEPHPPSSPGSS